jgi:hypothetical protein
MWADYNNLLSYEITRSERLALIPSKSGVPYLITFY